MEQAISCETFEGLCNRINAIASAMATGRPIHLRWAVNRHCPIRFEELFNETFDIEILNEEVESYEYGRSASRLCWFYPQNVDRLPFGVFQQRIFRAYRRLLEGMRIETWAKPMTPALGIAYRRHLQDTDNLGHYWHCIETVIRHLRLASVHIASDCLQIKEELSARLKSSGIPVSVNECPLLAHDYDRSPANVLGMCADLRSLACCALGVVTNSARSTVTDPLRGFGVRGYFTLDDKQHRHHGRDHLFVEAPVEQLIAPPNSPPNRLRECEEHTSLFATYPTKDLPSAGATLSLCMIVRDSAATLNNCLTRIGPWVDEIVVVDMGSVDQTPEIVPQCGARVFSVPSCDDLAAARNQAFANANGDWILWLDADELIDEPNCRRLRQLLNSRIPSETLGFMLQTRFPATSAGHVRVINQVRLLRNRPNLHFERCDHEQLLPSNRRADGTVEWTDICINHCGVNPMSRWYTA